ncbi:MAG: citrate (Si)-synthase [Simkaniaceae bacterium]|nr:citrate (Si)-synthase [Simkaniaceae bacterium]
MKGKKVLFEITEEKLETGLRGYPIGYCTTSSVDPIKGLFYRGKPVESFCTKTPEEVMHYLITGKEEGVDDFAKVLKEESTLSENVTNHILELPRNAHPMRLLSIAVQLLGILEGKGGYREDQLQLIAKMPHLVATVINYHAGWGQTPKPRNDLSYMENFTHMLNVPKGDKTKLIAIMELINILHYDHAGGNLSTFVGKSVASGLQDMYGSIAASMLALGSVRHGKANQDCLEFSNSLILKYGKEVTDEQIEDCIRERLKNRELVFGFGHGELRAEDVRASILYAFSKKHYPDHPLVKIALRLREICPKILKENPRISSPYPNVDAISGTALSAAGFEYPEYFTLLFGLARVVGISTQIVYERLEARSGKGTPIVHPQYLYRNP